ncbi:MAG: serine hydrolase domain-containing protein, partial [Acidimicrobiales bacterium]
MAPETTSHVADRTLPEDHMAERRVEGEDTVVLRHALDASLVARLDRRLQDEQASRCLPTVVAGLSRNGDLLWHGVAGGTGLPDATGAADPAGVTTVQFRIGSISKTFVAVSVLQLRDGGALDLSDRVGAHIPELRALPVTLAELLSHTSGLRAETPAPWWERVAGGDFATLAAAALRREDLLWRPGRRFHYSNVGYAVLGEVVARRRDMPIWDVVRELLLSPLDMLRTTPRPVPPHAAGLAVHPHAALVHAEPEHDAGAMAPAGQLW